MRTRNLLSIALVLFVCSAGIAQPTLNLNPDSEAGGQFLQFEDELHDFGEVKEADGNAVHKFEFTNVSDKPIKLTYVKASCGCTATDYTQEVIAPGAKGYVTAEYRTAKRSGSFTKTVTVRAADTDNIGEDGKAKDVAKAETKILRFTGKVIPKPQGPEDKYPYEFGKLRFSTNHVSIGRLPHNQVGEARMVIYNQSDETVTFETITGLDEHISYTVEGNPAIAGKDSIVLNFKFDAAKANAFGFVHTSGEVKTTDETVQKRLYVSANIYEDFSQLSNEERAKAARGIFDETQHDFGTVASGENLAHDFTLTNKGQQDLIIRDLKTNSSAVTATAGKMTLKPGESTKIKTTFDTRGRRSQTTQTITVTLNDPLQPTTRLILKASAQMPDDQ